MNTLSINAKQREIVGKKVKNLRLKKQIPAAVFGKKFTTINLTIDQLEFNKVYTQAGHSSVVDLNIDGQKSESTLISEVQIDPLLRTPIHVGFHRINLKEELSTNVPIVIIGEAQSQAIKEGGIVVQTLQEVEITCLPADLPQRLEIDISKLAIGENISIKQLILPKGVTLTNKDENEFAIVSISEPTKEEVTPQTATPAPEATPTTPAK